MAGLDNFFNKTNDLEREIKRAGGADPENGDVIQFDADGNIIAAEAEAGVTANPVERVRLLQDSIASGAGSTTVRVFGEEGTVVNLSIVDTLPNRWIMSSDINTQTVTIPAAGSIDVTISYSQNVGTSSRSFRVQAQSGNNYPVLSDNIVQNVSTTLLSSVVLSNLSFGNDSATETITVNGEPNQGFTLTVDDVSPAGWITNGAITGATGTTNASGVNSSGSIIIPSADDDTVNRTFRVRATSSTDSTQSVLSQVIQQVHTQTSAAGNLQISAQGIRTGLNIDFEVTVSRGDAPFTAVLNRHATDSSVSPIETLNFSDLNTAQSFTTYDGSALSGASEAFYIHVTDNDGDTVAAMESFDFTNVAPTGSISITTGSATPAAGDTVVLTASFTDANMDPLTYQWQRATTDAPTTFTDISGATATTYTIPLETIDTNAASTVPTTAGWDFSNVDTDVGVLLHASRTTAGVSAAGTTELTWAYGSIGQAGNVVIAIWATDDLANIGTTEPFLTFTGNAAANSASDAGFGVFHTTGLGVTKAELNAAIPGLTQNQITDNLGGNGFERFEIPDANVRYFLGETTLPGTLQDGHFRVNVSDGTLTTASNSIEITPSTEIDLDSLTGITFGSSSDPWQGAQVAYYDFGNDGAPGFADGVEWATPGRDGTTYRLTIYTSAAQTTQIVQLDSSTSPLSFGADFVGVIGTSTFTQSVITSLINISTGNGVYLTSNRIYAIPNDHCTVEIV